MAVSTAPPTLLARAALLLTRFFADRVAEDNSFLLLLTPSVDAAVEHNKMQHSGFRVLEWYTTAHKKGLSAVRVYILIEVCWHQVWTLRQNKTGTRVAGLRFWLRI